VLIAIAQSTVVSHVRLLGVSPDLVLLFTVSSVLLRGVREGVLVALVGGLVLDALSGAPFGLATISLVAVTLLAGVGEINVFRAARFLPYVTITAVTLVYSVVFLSLLQMRGHVVVWGASLLRVVLPAMLVNLLCMPIVYGLCAWLRKRYGPRSVEWQ